MKKLIFAVILFPLFAGAQNSWNVEQGANYSTEPTSIAQLTADSEMSADVSTENTDVEIAGRWGNRGYCGRHSDYKCTDHRVFDTCERDNSHGIYGSCRDIGKRNGEIICSCR